MALVRKSYGIPTNHNGFNLQKWEIMGLLLNLSCLGMFAHISYFVAVF